MLWSVVSSLHVLSLVWVAPLHFLQPPSWSQNMLLKMIEPSELCPSLYSLSSSGLCVYIRP